MKADYKTMILSNQKLFDFLNQEFDILPTESDMNEIKIICKQIESEESKPPFDRNNFCIDIRAEQDSPLLPKFKEWMNKKQRYDYNWTSDYYGVKENKPIDTTKDWIDEINLPITTLSALRQHMPEIWEGEKEQWKPEWGKEYEFSAGNGAWEGGIYIAMNPRYNHEYLYMSLQTHFIIGAKHIRPIRTLRDEILSILYDPELSDGWREERVNEILALIEQKRGL